MKYKGNGAKKCSQHVCTYDKKGVHVTHTKLFSCSHQNARQKFLSHLQRLAPVNRGQRQEKSHHLQKGLQAAQKQFQT